MNQSRRPTVVVVGTGLAGARVVEEILARAQPSGAPRFHLRLFGDEPQGTYNRTLLTGVLGGFTDPTSIWLRPLEWYENQGIRVHAGVRAEAIDRNARVVTGAGGKVAEPYDHLILATGARPLVPAIEGTRQQGVFVFRTMQDCAAIAAWAAGCDRAVVVGGGLLGLEAARGLLSHALEVTVVESATRLMPRQLDPAGAGVLQRRLEAMGVEVVTGIAPVAVVGDGQVRGVRLEDGRELPAELVILACGVVPNVEEARAAGLTVERAIVVDDQMRTSDPHVFALGECVQHRGVVWGQAEPLAEQARVLADNLCGTRPASYAGARPANVLRVVGVDLVSLGDVQDEHQSQVLTHLDEAHQVYKKVIVRDGRIAGAVVVGDAEAGERLARLYRSGEALTAPPGELLVSPAVRGGAKDVAGLPWDTRLCDCHGVCKGELVEAIQAGSNSVAALGHVTRAGTGCGSCRGTLDALVRSHARPGRKARGKPETNRVEVVKRQKDGLDAWPDILALAEGNRWQELSEDDKTRSPWHGLFFRKSTPGHFMLRLRASAGRLTAEQLRVVAGLAEEFGRGFADLTTRQQIQLRWFTLADVPEIRRRLDDVGLSGRQTGMDNVRGVCGCPAAGVTPHELLDATAVVEEVSALLAGTKEFSNLPRKFNVAITGCLENCCPVEAQDLGLVPAFRELDGERVKGFNVLVGGKHGSGGYQPALPLDVFVRAEEAARLCREITLVFRDHGLRATRSRARLRFLIEERGAWWLRGELARRWGEPLLPGGTDLRKSHQVDHLGILPQKPGRRGQVLFSVGLLVPVGRITAKQLHGVADLADCYGSGEVRLTPQQNLIIPDVPDRRVGALTEEPLLKELPYDPSPVMRGLVSCTGIDYCHLALIETKGRALEVARELERLTAGQKVAPLSIHWSGCAAGCGLHSAATIGLQGVRARVGGAVVGGAIVDAVHVSVRGAAGPEARVGTELMRDVPCDRLVEALLPLVRHLPR